LDAILNLDRKVNRREALSTAAKVATGVVVAGVAAGIGGYLAGSAVAPVRTQTVTEHRPTTVTVTAPPTTVVTPTPVVWSYKEAARPYRGTTIRVVTENTPPAVFLKEEVAPKFEEETGIQVEWEAVSWGDMYAKEITDLESGTGVYDAFYVEQDIIYTYMGRGWLTDLTIFGQRNPALVDPKFDPDDFTAFGDAFKDPVTGHFYAYPFEAFLKTYWYREDYYEKLGVKPAETWDEFIELSKKFYEWGKDQPGRVYGVGFQMIGITLPYLFVEGFFPAHGVYTWGINLATMRASVEKGGTLNSDRAVKAFEDFFKLLELAPPETPTFSWGGNVDAMAAGRTPHGPCEYSEAAGAALAKDPTLRLRCTLPPLLPEVKREVLARPKTDYWKAYVNYYDGGAFGIPYSSRNKEAAFLFVQYMTRKEGSRVTATKAFAPTRKSVIEELIPSDLNKKTGYFTLLKENDWMYAPAPPFREHKLLIERFYDKWIHKIVAKEVGIKEGLDQLAKEIDDMLEALGY
jgi:multiple sugar transport system substrate-binding protein